MGRVPIPHVPITRRGFFAAPLGLAGQGRAEEPAPRPVRIEEVAPGVFVHAPPVALASRTNRGDIANLGLIVGADSAAVIDTGSTLRIGESWRAAIGAATDRPVRYVINTHMHPDHVMGNAAFAAEGVNFVGHRNLPRALMSRADAYARTGRTALDEDPLRGGKVVLPRLLVEGELNLDLGRRTLRLKAWPPAHTDNDLSVFDERTATLLAGDLLFAQHLPVVDGSLKGWLRIMDGLRAIPAGRVVPGHGPASLAWPAALVPEQRYLDRLAADIRVLIAQGAPIEAAAKRAAQSERGGWALFDDFNPRNATAAYSELEWE